MNIPGKCLYARMSELVEWLGGDYPPELEIEDLRALITNLAGTIDSQADQINELRHEIERLRSETLA